MAEQAKARILLVDDDPIVLESLSSLLAEDGYDISTASDIATATAALDAGRFNLVITDVSMPTCDGFELLRHVRSRHEEIQVILMTGYGTIESAVEAMKQGAYDYLTKPIIDDDVRLAVRRSLARQDLLAENRSLRQALAARTGTSNVITTDVRMGKILDLATAAADSASTVLITGQSGTGKSLIARAIHAQSPRRDAPFVEVACGALPDTLLESELFGYVKGAFTHAVVDKPGKFAAAAGGTLFLDEISTASPQLQVKLLRVLQERRFEPLGSNDTLAVDVRVILATNHDLWAEVQAGRFRSDLYYRINVVNIDLPPLCERLGDIPLLAEYFLTKYLAATSRTVDGFTRGAMQAMQSYHWPGNVRELENCVERAVVLCRSGLIDTTDLAPAVLDAPDQNAPRTSAYPAGATLAESLALAEKRIIQTILDANSQSRNRTADQLGVNRTTLFKKMRKHGLLGR